MSRQSFVVDAEARARTVVGGEREGRSRRVTRHITFEFGFANPSSTDSYLILDSSKGLKRMNDRMVAYFNKRFCRVT